MTGDVEEVCPMLQLEDTVTIHPSSSAFIHPDIAVEDACIYTATIPTELAGNFPEGSVLQIMPDSTIVAVKNLPLSDETSVVFKDNSLPVENRTSLNLPHLLTEPNPNNQTHVCPEENMDIDLSFLNESEMIPDPKCLGSNALQGMMAASQSLPVEEAKSVQEQEALKDSLDQAVVMIDVSKPIQLSQNSLIMVNGQKCVLQHDTQTGQVLAYPVREQEKPRRRRGRPRKAWLEQTSKGTEQNDDDGKCVTGNVSEEEREKGLLEVMNDDGALVRRSSRKRKKAKALRDYETGNLKQELGSDVEDAEAPDREVDSHRKRGNKGPGRPKKFPKEPETDANTGVRRQRGRPKKMCGEPSQAFLVQTADGQALMMQVPLSSIPAGISLQEMAQEIANKLNLGMNQGTETKDLKDEVALQDQSVGSTTTHCPGLQSTGEMNCETEEVVLESENSVQAVTVSNNIPCDQTELSTLEVPRCSKDNFSVHLPSAAPTADSTSVCFDPLTDHDFCLPRSSATEIMKSSSESTEMKKGSFEKDVRNKVSVKLLLSNKDNITTSLPIQDFLNKSSNSENPSEFLLDTKEFCGASVLHRQMPNVEIFSEQVSDSGTQEIDGENCLQVDGILAKNACTVESGFSNAVKSHINPQQFVVPDALSSGDQTVEVLLSIEKVSSSIQTSVTDTVVTSTSTIVTPTVDLPLHGQIVNGAKQCKICSVQYLKDEEIIEHFKLKHPRCICTECNYMNEHPYIIKRHAFRHTSQGCICKLCNKKYKDMYILKMHIKMVHLPPDVLYACDVCEKKFTRKAHLKRHLRIHAPVKHFQCPHCDYKGCEKSDITKHMLIHEEPKFQCEVCGKAFRHLKNKELHLKRHSGQRDYKCAACGFFGYTYTDIRKHIERRHSTSCPQCKQVFTDSELCKEHKRTCPLPDPINEMKVLDNPGEEALLDEMTLDILGRPPRVMACSEETLSALQSGQLVMTSVEGILSAPSLIIEDTSDKDLGKMITVVTADGTNVSLPLKSCSSLPLENDENSLAEPFVITTETEVAS